MFKYVQMIHARQKTWDETEGITPKMSIMQMYRGSGLHEFTMSNLPVALIIEMIQYLEKFEATFDFCFDYFKAEKTESGEEFCVVNQCSIFIVEVPQATAFKMQYATKR